MYGSNKSLKKRIGSNTNTNRLNIITNINGHINEPENVSLLNMSFIEALIMVLFSSTLKYWLPYNKKFTNASLVKFEISLTIFWTVSKWVWRDCIKWWQCSKKWTMGLNIMNNGFKIMPKSMFIPSHSLATKLIPNRSWILKFEFCIGLPIFNSKLTFLTVTSSLFHSTVVYGKKEYLNRSVLQ